MSSHAFIHFNGNCREAVGFYAKVFKTTTTDFHTYGGMPSDSHCPGGKPLSEKEKDLIAFTYLKLHGNEVMFSDMPPEAPFTAGNNLSLMINSTDLVEIKSLFAKLKEGGKVWMEPQKTFWSPCYAALTDKFGIQWHLNGCEKG